MTDNDRFSQQFPVFDSEDAGSDHLSTNVRIHPSTRINCSGSGSNLSSSYSSFSHRIPTRSYVHNTVHGGTENIHYSSQGVREQTQELASWALGESPKRRSSFSYFSQSPADTAALSDGPRTSIESTRPDIIEEEVNGHNTSTSLNHSASALTRLFHPLKQPLPRASFSSRAKDSRPSVAAGPDIVIDDVEATAQHSETTPLLNSSNHYNNHTDASFKRTMGIWNTFQSNFSNILIQMKRPERWDVEAIFRIGVGTTSAVFLGLLLNVLDALSYGMILFPLGEPIFAKTGPDGISMFYVSCIIAQLTYSFGGSAFKGGIGSEMIEVVPFFHKMAHTILDELGDDDPEAVLATVIASYALSSVLTGLLFLLLGALRLGDLVSFFPRSILLGCIGGVGVFLVITGIEVSAGLDSSLGLNFDEIQRIFTPSTLMLWVVPLLLAISLMIIRKYYHHPVVMPAFFVAIVAVFYSIVTITPNLTLQDMRYSGWVFKAPDADIPFYNFYTYYKFNKINWTVLASTIPSMLALSFFGIIHVPINVPALAIAVQHDDIHINRELFGHGISNAVSGLLGSIQNYLVFANSRLFIQNGGNSRWAGIFLALATGGIWISGPAMIGFIPIMIVGALIFMLGIEMVQEALLDTFGKLHWLEYGVVFSITFVMGIHDFVVGIFLGIVLACLIFILQTSRVSAISATYSGQIVSSTVRRHPAHRRFLVEVGGQIRVHKLSGYLFFGSIVAVERRVKQLLDQEYFTKQPLRYLVLDFSHVGGIDFSAAEAFVRMNRTLRNKDVEMVFSGITISGDIGKSLVMVGLLEHEPSEESDPPRVFENLNAALEACENELLLAFKLKTEQLGHDASISNAQIPSVNIPPPSLKLNITSQLQLNSPRKNQVAEATTNALKEHDLTIPAKWVGFTQPLPLILQAFKDATTKDYEFWHKLSPYFTRFDFAAGATLFRRGDRPEGLYLLEEGLLTADHELEQGRFSESIVAGTTVGELPIFSESTRNNATVIAEQDSVLWLLDKNKWEKLEKDAPDLAIEMLRVALRLASERMDTVTSYVLVQAS